MSEVIAQLRNHLGRRRVEPCERAFAAFGPKRLDRGCERVVWNVTRHDVGADDPVDELSQHQSRSELGHDLVRCQRARLTCEHVAHSALREHEHRRNLRDVRAELIERVGEVGSQLGDGRPIYGRPKPDARSDVVEKLREGHRHRPSMPPSAVICAESYGAGTPRMSRVTPSPRRRSRCPLSSPTHRGDSDALTVDDEVGARVRPVSRASSQLAELRVVRRRVEPVADSAGELRHLRTEPTDDDRRRGIRAQEAVATGPHVADRFDRALDLRSPRRVAGNGAPERPLLLGVGRARAATGADAEQQPSPGRLLQRRRHDCEDAGLAVRDVEHERPDRDAIGARRDRWSSRVQHSSTWLAPWTRPARWSHVQMPSKPASSAACAALHRVRDSPSERVEQ